MTFETSANRSLGSEGRYSLDPKDPGGETNWGISKRSYPNLDIKNLNRDAAIGIYRTDFWNRINADLLPPLLQFQVFDFAVNCGIETAVRKMQTSLGVADDGHWGPVTMQALRLSDPVAVTLMFFAEELDYRRKLSGFADYGRGWTARVANDLRYAAADYTQGKKP